MNKFSKLVFLIMASFSLIFTQGCVSKQIRDIQACIKDSTNKAACKSLTRVLAKSAEKVTIESRGNTKTQAKIYAGYKAEEYFKAYKFISEDCNTQISGHGSASRHSASYSEESYIVCAFEVTQE